MLPITSLEYIDAVNAWYAYPHHDPGKAFMDYLGIHHYQAHTDGYSMPPEAATRLRLLLSPHAHTIIRMYYARQSDRGSQ